MCLFEYCTVISLVMPGKPSFRRLDSLSAFGIERALLEKTLRCQPVIKHHDIDFKGLVSFHDLSIPTTLKLTSHLDKDHKDRTAFLKLDKRRENEIKCMKKNIICKFVQRSYYIPARMSLRLTCPSNFFRVLDFASTTSFVRAGQIKSKALC